MNNINKSAIDIIHSRKSVRHFTDDTVSKDVLEKIIKAGMAAPTAVNKQPWSFIIVTDREKLNRLADSLPFCKMLYFAPAAIVVCGIPELSLEEHSLELTVLDCAAATENILLAIESYGLGGVWTAAYPYNERMATTRLILQIPNNVIPINVIPVGYSSGKDEPKDKWKPERIHWEKW